MIEFSSGNTSYDVLFDALGRELYTLIITASIFLISVFAKISPSLFICPDLSQTPYHCPNS